MMSIEYNLGDTVTRAGADKAKATIESEWLPKSPVGTLSALHEHGGEIVIKDRELLSVVGNQILGYRVVLLFSNEGDHLVFQLKYGKIFVENLLFVAVAYAERDAEATEHMFRVGDWFD